MRVQLHWADYLVLAAFLVISLGIGVYHSLTGGRQRTTTEFIMANRSLSVLPTSISMLVSFISAIMILGSSAEMYSYGAQQMLMAGCAFALGTLIGALFFVPWLFPLKLVSVNEYLQMRYDSKVIRMLGSVLGIVAGIIYMGSAMFAPSVALEAATGLPITVSIPVMAVVAVSYTALGGMRAVIWTDVFQFLIMFFGLIAVLVKGLVVVGGVSKVVELCAEGGRLEWANWSPDPTQRNTVWAFLFGWSIAWANQFGMAQAAVQRYSATTSLAKAKQILLINIPAQVIMNTAACCTGLVVFAYYAMIKCDPLVNQDIENSNQILPYFVTNVFSGAPGFTGLFLSTLYGGALSSVSSSLSGASANLWEDVLKWRLSEMQESRRALLNRLIVVAFGIAATGMAFTVSVMSGTVIQVCMSLTGSIGGPMAAMFILGGLTRFVHWKGLLIGTAVGLLTNVILVMGSIRLTVTHPTLPSVSLEGCPALNTSQPGWLSGTIPGIQEEATVDWLHLGSNDLITTERIITVDDLGGMDRVFAISYHWYLPLGLAVTMIVSCIASLVIRDPKAAERVEERLLFSFMRRREIDSEQSSKDDNDYRSVSDKNNNNGKSTIYKPVFTRVDTFERMLSDEPLISTNKSPLASLADNEDV